MKRLAVQKAIAAGESRVLVEVDEGEDRKQIVVRPEYLDEGEFEAFDGRVLGWAYPDGSFVWSRQ